MRYYKVICERGHVGHGRQAPISFYFAASNALEAMEKGKLQPGIKHTRMPLSCKEVSYKEYVKKMRVSAYIRAGVR